MIKRVTVFCSSSDTASPMFFSEMENLSKCLVEAEIEIVYGGAKVGLMGRLADSVLQHKGRIYGIIPEYLNHPDIVHNHLTGLKVVSDLLDRKRAMLKGSDAVIAFPGGIGTIDEITEVIALKQLGEYNQPIYFLNFLDAWQPLLDFFVELKQRNMIAQTLADLYKSFESSHDLMNEIKAYRGMKDCLR